MTKFPILVMATLLSAPAIGQSGQAAPVKGATALAGTEGDDAVTGTLVTNTCSACHEFDRVSGQQFSEDEWTQKVQEMIGFGAQVSDADKPRIIHYLARHYGPAQ